MTSRPPAARRLLVALVVAACGCGGKSAAPPEVFAKPAQRLAVDAAGVCWADDRSVMIARPNGTRATERGATTPGARASATMARPLLAAPSRRPGIRQHF